MLWGQSIKMYTNHKNLVRDVLGLTCYRVYLWQLRLEEYGPKGIYIKGADNIVADAISWLDFDKKIKTYNINAQVCNMGLVQFFNGCVTKTTKSKALKTDNMYIPIGTGTFVNQLESARAKYSTITFISCEK